MAGSCRPGCSASITVSPPRSRSVWKRQGLCADRLLPPHKGILLVAVEGGLGICILFDALLKAYDAEKDEGIHILESIEVEGSGAPY